jgi:hypothetical protein
VRTQKIYAIAAVLTLAAMVSAISAFAQTEALRANIPFDFYVAGRLLPAGTYTLVPSTLGTSINVSDRDGNSVYVMTASYRPNHAVDNNRLVFHRYGTTSFLTSIYWIGFPNGKELAKSDMERQLAKGGNTPTSVALLVK